MSLEHLLLWRHPSQRKKGIDVGSTVTTNSQSRERSGRAPWGFVPPGADHRIGVPLHRHGHVRPARREARRVSNSGLKRPIWGWKCAPIQSLIFFEPIQGLKLIFLNCGGVPVRRHGDLRPARREARQVLVGGVGCRVDERNLPLRVLPGHHLIAVHRKNSLHDYT